MNEKRNKPSFTDHLALQVPAILVMSLSLWLFVFAAKREAERTYPQRQLEILAHQGELTKHNMERFLKAGVRLKHFVGFSIMTDPLLDKGSWVQEIMVYNMEGQLVFFNSREKEKAQKASDDPWQTGFNLDSEVGSLESKFKSDQRNAHYKVTLPLSDKFEEVGLLMLSMPKDLVKNQIEEKVQGITITMIICIVVFGVLIFFIRGVYRITSRKALLVSYILTFVIASLLVNRSLQTLSVEGIKESATAIADSLAERISMPHQFDLRYDDFSKVQESFSNAKEVNPSLDFVALVSEGTIRFHSDPSLTGSPWTNPSETLNLTVPLASSEDFVVAGISKKEIQASFWQIIIDYAYLFLLPCYCPVSYFGCSTIFLFWASKPLKYPPSSCLVVHLSCCSTWVWAKPIAVIPPCNWKTWRPREIR